MASDQSRPGGRQPHPIADYLGGRWVWIVVALCAVVAGAISLAVQPSRTTTADRASTTTISSSTTAASSAVSPTPSTSTSTTIAPPTSTAPEPTDVPDHTDGPPVTGVWTMPDETGKSLNTAKNAIEKLTDGAEVPVAVRDVSGANRHPIVHQNWTVCAQTPPAGQKFTVDSGVTFDVVKKNETCPDNGV